MVLLSDSRGEAEVEAGEEPIYKAALLDGVERFTETLRALSWAR